jgi:hypothetical protein
MFVICNPENRRVELFQNALRNLGLPPARVVAYIDLLAGHVDLSAELMPAAVVRIESPGEDFEVEKALLLAGVEAAAAEGSPVIEAGAIQRLQFDRD